MDRPTKRFLITNLLITAGYFVVTAAAAVSVLHGSRTGAVHPLTNSVRWGMSASFGLFIAGQIWATLVFMRDSDEFVRALFARQFILASGLAIASFSAWGYAETFAGAPHIPGWMVYILLLLFLGAVQPFVRSTRD